MHRSTDATHVRPPLALRRHPALYGARTILAAAALGLVTYLAVTGLFALLSAWQVGA